MQRLLSVITHFSDGGMQRVFSVIFSGGGCFL
jgi:hypothetical protein